MAVPFRIGHGMTMEDLQDIIRQKDDEIAEMTWAHNQALTDAGVALDQEKAEHAAKKRRLENLQRELDRAKAKIAAYIEKFGDLDREVVARQSWIDWYQSVQYDANQLRIAYRKSCVENNINSGKQRSKHALRYVDKDSVRRERGLVVDPEENFEMQKHFPFMRLVNEVPEIARKIALTTMRKGTIVHFIARLDTTEQYPPERGGLCTVAKIPMRFWWGPGKTVNINSAPTISETLAPLAVCRDFLEIFGHAFFTQNKFSFASFGEINIFKRHIRHSWLQRIRSIEIWWQGSSNHLPLDWGVEPENDFRYDRRTWPLMILTWMSRLKSIEIYVDESSKEAKRRPNEPHHIQENLILTTRGQDNHRMFRDLRKLHGLDYVYQLKGMKRVSVYDMMAEEKRTEVKDKTFVRDMRVQTMGPKTKRRGRESRIGNLKSMLRYSTRPTAEEVLEGALEWDEAYTPYEKSPQVDWIGSSFLDPNEKWDPNRILAGGQNRAGGSGGGGGGSGDAPGDGGEDPGNGGDGPQDRDNGSDSDSSDDNSLFVHQPNSSGVVSQPSRFHGRRNMGRGANGAPTHGFGEAIEIDSDDDDDDIIVDDDRSAPANRRGVQIDLTNIPDEEPAQVKDEDKEMDVDDDPATNPAQDSNPVADDNGVKADDGTAPVGSVSQPENAVGDDAHSQEPKPDEDVNMPDIYGASPGLGDGAAGPSAPNMISQMLPNGEFQVQDVQVPGAEMGDPQGAFAASLVVAQPSIPGVWESPMPSVERPEQPIIIDLDDYDDDVQFIEARFEPIKIEDDDDDDLPPLEEILARSHSRSINSSSAPTHGRGADGKIEESKPASTGSTQGTPNVIGEAANLRRSLTPAGRYVTPDPYGTPSSSRAADEDELDFDTPTPKAPRASDPRRDSSSSSGDNASVRSSATSRKRSRDEDASAPRPVEIDQMVSPARRSSRSSGISASVTRGVDELDLMGDQHDGAGDSQLTKHRRSSPREQSESEADIANIQHSWLKSLPKK